MLHNVRLAFSPNQGRVAFEMSCEMRGPRNITYYSNLAEPETHGAPFEVLQQRLAAPLAGSKNAALRQNMSQCEEVQEDTILLMSPRGEDLGNVYHDMEAVFGLLQTADVLKRNLSDFRLLILYGNISRTSPDGFLDLVQLDGQVDGLQQGLQTNTSAGRSGMVPKMLPQLLELWSHLAQRPKGSTLRRLPASVSTADGLCFRGRVVLPIHACSGEILSRVWSSDPDVHEASALALKYAQRILQAFQLDWMPSHIPTSIPKTALILFRGKAGAQNGRQMRFLDREDLEDRLPKEANVSSKSLDFARLSFAEQIRQTRNSSILISMHGAGLTNLIFLPDHGGVVEITEWTPPYGGSSIANIYWNLAAWTRKHYYAVKGIQREPYVNFLVDDVIRGVKSLLKLQVES